MLIKVLNACVPLNHYWVFFAATTNVEFAVTVTDTQNGTDQEPTSTRLTGGSAGAGRDAFATCP